MTEPSQTAETVRQSVERYEPVVTRQIMETARGIAAQLLLYGTVVLTLEGEAQVGTLDSTAWTITKRTVSSNDGSEA